MWLLFEFYLSTDIDNIKRSEAVNQRKTCIERSKDSKRRGREKTTE